MKTKVYWRTKEGLRGFVELSTKDGKLIYTLWTARQVAIAIARAKF